METHSTSEKYIKDFSAQDYFDRYYSPNKGALLGQWVNFALTNLHKAFSPGGIKGETLIDIATGPVIYHLLSACEVFENIITSDLLEQNRAELQKWLKKEPGALDWTNIVKRVCELEGNRENWEKKEEKLRRAVKQVLKCDVLKKKPFEPITLPPADCLIGCLCLEGPCPDVAAYCNALKSFKDLIKPGGHIIIQGLLNATFYFVGENRFPALPMTKERVEKAFMEAGFEIKNLIIVPREDRSWSDIADFDSLYCVHARKPDTA
ncbi:nicotinamide N-methyltransferase-like [Spea bombifrons]|uniref:nicotinamide N-methyltransferase-like n=1 Tax=Spea bombifrons TaxID=233779 RepID=UPI00234A9384|nr:nicotinamide N-methyltransferase-like [Spea bombifrons]